MATRPEDIQEDAKRRRRGEGSIARSALQNRGIQRAIGSPGPTPETQPVNVPDFSLQDIGVSGGAGLAEILGEAGTLTRPESTPEFLRNPPPGGISRSIRRAVPDSQFSPTDSNLTPNADPNIFNIEQPQQDRFGSFDPNRAAFRTADGSGFGSVASEGAEGAQGIARINRGVQDGVLESPSTVGSPTGGLGRGAVNILSSGGFENTFRDASVGGIGPPAQAGATGGNAAPTNQFFEEADRLINQAGRVRNKGRRDAILKRAEALSNIGKSLTSAQTATNVASNRGAARGPSILDIAKFDALQQQRALEAQQRDVTAKGLQQDRTFRQQETIRKGIDEFVDSRVPEGPERGAIKTLLTQFGVDSPQDIPQAFNEILSTSQGLSNLSAVNSTFLGIPVTSEPGITRNIFGDDAPDFTDFDQFEFGVEPAEGDNRSKLTATERSSGRRFNTNLGSTGILDRIFQSPATPTQAQSALRSNVRSKQEREDRRKRLSN